MRRKISLLAIAALLSILTGCAPTPTTSPPPTPTTPTPEVTPTPGPTPIPKPAKLTASDGRIKITVESIERTSIMPDELEAERDRPLVGYSFITVQLHIESVANGHASPSPPEILVDTSGGEYTPMATHFSIILEDPSDFEHSDYYYEEGKPGTLVYELPEEAEPSVLRFPYRRTGTEDEGVIEVQLDM